MIGLILLLAFGVRLIQINQSFWLDEAAQVIESARPFILQFSIAGDFQPPLFHVLLHYWMSFGRSETWIRLLPILFGVITVYFTYKLGALWMGKKIGLLTAFFLAISPYHVWYSQEVRPYALSAMLGIVATYFLFSKQWWKYCLSAIAFIYSMYLAPFLLIGHGAYVLFFERKQIKNWLLSMLGIFLGFLPWLPKFWEQLHIGTSLTSTLPGWSEAVSVPVIKAIPLIFVKFVLGRITIDNKILYMAIFVFLAVLFLYLLKVGFQKINQKLIPLVVLFATSILTAVGVSIFIPIIAPQRVLFLLPLFLLIIVISVDQLTRYKRLTLLALTGICVVSLCIYWTQPRFQREQWRQAVAYIEESRSAKSLAVFVFPTSFAPWQWYTRGIILQIGVAPQFVLRPEDLQNNLSIFQKYDRLYVFGYLTDLTDPNHSLDEFLTTHGFIETTQKDFPGVGIISIYEKALAAI